MRHTQSLLLTFSLLASSAAMAVNVNADGDLNLEDPKIAAAAPARCEKPDSPLLKKKKILELDIIADHSKIHEEYNGSGIGVIGIKRSNKKGTEYVPVEIGQRGNSRRSYCNFKPLRLTFLDEVASQEIVNTELQKAGAPINVPNKLDSAKNIEVLKGIYTAVKGAGLAAGRQDNNIFDGLGDDLKLVTHCGKTEWVVGGDEVEMQEQKVIAEHVIYQILSLLKSTTLTTRLAKINYLNPDGSLKFTRMGMFRENPSSVAERCGLEKGMGNYREYDKTSEIQANFINNMIYMNDYSLGGHNMKHANKVDENGEVKVHFIPYDYDLSGIIVPEYFKNGGVSLADNAEKTANYLRKTASQNEEDKLRVQIQLGIWLSKKEKAMERIEESGLAGTLKDRFLEWHETHFSALQSLSDELGPIQ